MTNGEGFNIGAAVLGNPTQARYMQQLNLMDAARGKARQEKNAQYLDMLKYEPDKYYETYTNPVNDMVDDLKGFTTEAYRRGIGMDDVNFQKERNRRMSTIQRYIDRTNQVKSVIDELNKRVHQSDYVGDKDYYLNKINETLFDEEGNPLDPRKVDLQSLSQIVDNDVGGWDTSALAKGVWDNIGEYDKQIVKLVKYGADDEPTYRTDVTKKKAPMVWNAGEERWELDADNEELKKSIENDPKYRKIFEYKINELGMDPEEVIRQDFAPFVGGVFNQRIGRGVRKDRDSDGDEQRGYYSESQTKVSNIPVQRESGEVEPLPTLTLGNYRLSGKKQDKPLYVTPNNFYDFNTGKDMSHTGSEMAFVPTRVMMVPVDAANQTKVYDIYDEQILREQMINGAVRLNWMVQGVVQDEDGMEKTIMIPVDNVKADLKAQYGFDIDNRQVSEMSNFEVVQMINNKFPNLTPQEKVAKFKQIKSIIDGQAE
jgi:hypothetical protein